VGTILGLVLFVVSLFGVPVHVYIGSFNLWDIGAGAFALIFAPAVCAIMAAILAAVAYLPFTLIMRHLNGIKLTAEIEHTSNTEII